MCGSWPDPPGNMVLEAMEPSWQSSPKMRLWTSSRVGCCTIFSKMGPITHREADVFVRVSLEGRLAISASLKKTFQNHWILTYENVWFKVWNILYGNYFWSYFSQTANEPTYPCWGDSRREPEGPRWRLHDPKIARQVVLRNIQCKVRKLMFLKGHWCTYLWPSVSLPVSTLTRMRSKHTWKCVAFLPCLDIRYMIASRACWMSCALKSPLKMTYPSPLVIVSTASSMLMLELVLKSFKSTV